MFRNGSVNEIGAFKMTAVNGALFVTDGVQIVKVVLEIPLTKVTGGRIKGFVDTEKLFYGIAVPFLKPVEREALMTYMTVLEREYIDIVISHVLFADHLNVLSFQQALNVVNGVKVRVQSKMVNTVAA